MNGTADDRYFEWLYGQIGSVRNKNPGRSHWNLARQLYRKRFFWFVHNDDNRAMDGKRLRTEFIGIWGDEGIDREWMELDCSFLEMLIALSRHLAFESLIGTPGDWFWKMLENLGLDKYTDEQYRHSAEEDIDDAMERVMRRTYGRDGSGGLFPLREPHVDQRLVEIWYQVHAYLLEGDRVANGPKI